MEKKSNKEVKPTPWPALPVKKGKVIYPAVYAARLGEHRSERFGKE